MEQDKLISMKKVMEYQQAVDNFPAEQAALKKKIEDTKTANALIAATLRGIVADKKYINELREKNEEQMRMEAQDEEEEEEEGLNGVDEDVGGEDAETGAEKEEQEDEEEEAEQMLQGLEQDDDNEEGAIEEELQEEEE